jgi:hypothetical protein
MSQYGRRFALHEFEIAACEPDALWRRGQQPARLSDEPLGVLFGESAALSALTLHRPSR